MRILWVSNDPRMKTGYGTQTAQACARLAQDHDVAVLANAGTSGRVEEWEGLTIFPQGYDTWSNDIVSAVAKYWQADQIIVLFDAWPLDPKAYSETPTAVWCPIDHATVPPRVNAFFRDSGATPIAMSEYGQHAFAVQGQQVPYVPHGIDTRTFRRYDRLQARRELGFPDGKFLVGMVSTNKGNTPSRKAFPEAFRTFAAFAKAVPDALLYVHAEAFGQSMGIDLRVLASHYELKPDNLIFCDQLAYRFGIEDDQMAKLYSSLDVLSFVSMGEGFGIPTIEAQACGTPVITGDFTVQKELNPYGWRVGGQQFWDDALKADFQMPDDRLMLDALVQAYEARDDQTLRRQCRTFAEGYDADLVYANYWKPALDQLAQTPETVPL